MNSKLNKSGQHLSAEVLKTAKQLSKSRGNANYKLTFRWSAGHIRIKGNKDADKIAKEAADRNSSAGEDLPTYLRKQIKHSLSAMRQACNEEHKTRWKKVWSKSPQFCRIRYSNLLTPSSQKFLSYISNKEILRKSTSRIFQLRVGHAPLNQYLHRFKRVDSPHCPACGHFKETLEHFLLFCPSYEHERWLIKNAIGGYLPKIARLLTDPKLLRPLANFIEASGRYNLDSGTRDFPVRVSQPQR
jgi:hypothetical protein